RNAVAAENAADRLRIVGLDLGDVQAQLETWPAPRHPDDSLTEDLCRQLLAIHRCRDRDTGIRMEVINMRRSYQPMHRGVDRGRGSTLAMQAIVERRHHLVL